MDFRRGPIHAQGNHLHPGILDLRTDLLGNQGAVGGKTHPQALLSTIAGNIKDIMTKQRLAA